MTLDEFREKTKDLPGDLKLFTIQGNHEAFEVWGYKGVLEHLGYTYWEYSDADGLDTNGVKISAIIFE